MPESAEADRTDNLLPTSTTQAECTSTTYCAQDGSCHPSLEHPYGGPGPVREPLISYFAATVHMRCGYVPTLIRASSRPSPNAMIDTESLFLELT